MFIAKEIRKTSIAEYILYMWQLEDLIRAYDCSLSRISDEYISKFNYTDEQKAAENEWFGNRIRMMNEEETENRFRANPAKRRTVRIRASRSTNRLPQRYSSASDGTDAYIRAISSVCL